MGGLFLSEMGRRGVDSVRFRYCRTHPLKPRASRRDGVRASSHWQRCRSFARAALWMVPSQSEERAGDAVAVATAVLLEGVVMTVGMLGLRRCWSASRT